MSRIGKTPITVPDSVNAAINDRVIEVKGLKGTLSHNFGYEIDVRINGKEIIFTKKANTRLAQALWGTTRALVQNMIFGVTEGFKKELELHGVGYKMALQGKKIIFNLGFSHTIEIEIPEGLNVSIDKNVLAIEGLDKQQVGQLAAEIRALRKVEPYKGKGFRYVGEQFIKKEGKRVVGTE
ncbi:MAG: 50S ribosomal protein L6 [Patescibacteria group bacterium]|nr:50S ribosomal protein L6 [Patescibacteria group bacterium]